MAELEGDREIPLFPLHSILYPSGSLSLRLFEARYLDMFSDCLKRSRPFGVVLIREGEETGPAAACHEYGTLAEILDWDQQPGGLLEIRVVGGRRFRIISSRIAGDQLTTAQVVLQPEAPWAGVAERQCPLVELLRELMRRAGEQEPASRQHFDNADWVSWRLAERVPLSMQQRQYLLQIDDGGQRLDYLGSLLSLKQ